MEVPRFNGIARSYLLHIGGLDWHKINPHILGSTSTAVPNTISSDWKSSLNSPPR